MRLHGYLPEPENAAPPSPSTTASARRGLWLFIVTAVIVAVAAILLGGR